MNRSIVALDTETATSRGAPHLLELGAVRVQDGEIVDQFEALCRPQVPIDPEAGAVHGIEAADVLGAEAAPEVLAAFLDWLGDDWLAAHDAPKDARVLGFELARARLELPAAPWICTLRLARKLIPEAPDYRLETLCEVLELEDGPRHRALADAVWCHQVLEACAARVDREHDAAPPADPVGAERLLALAGGVPTTVAGHGPAPTRMKSRWRPLVEACNRGESLTLLYGSEDQPPVQLTVTPQLMYSADKKGFLEAECVSSGTLRTYRLDRIHRVLQRT